MDLEELKTFVPKSNWERYFSKIANCDDKYLDKRWEQLYQLRNQVAHNAIISKSQYEDIVLLSQEVCTKLQFALSHIDEIQIENVEREQIISQLETAIEDIFAETVTVSLLQRNNELPSRSGLNWGQREGRDSNQAYLRIPGEIQSSNFFPPSNVAFTVVTDDGQVLICKRAQENGKAIHAAYDDNLLGKYFRERLGLQSGALITKEDLVKYGRSDITFHKLQNDLFFMDFSIKKDND